MDHIESNCEVAGSLDVKELMTQRDAPLDLDGDETLKTTFKNTLKILKKLEKNKVTTSESEMMVNLILQLEDRDDFDEEVVEWKLKTNTQQTWTNFQTHFDKANRLRRTKNKTSSRRRRPKAPVSSANAVYEAPITT